MPPLLCREVVALIRATEQHLWGIQSHRDRHFWPFLRDLYWGFEDKSVWEILQFLDWTVQPNFSFLSWSKMSQRIIYYFFCLQKVFVLKWANPGLFFFVYFRFFSNTHKTVEVSRIWTRIVRVEMASSLTTWPPPRPNACKRLAANLIAIAPWYRVHLPFCGRGFKSQAHNLHYFQFVSLKL